ncbi:MAG: SDR family NAD(P)-dependent oxidoreductase [Pseudomonadales bacterium]|nr:SDR family NAD(P)-dependent oxidoreductase [Pseudomonadales bacterium]
MIDIRHSRNTSNWSVNDIGNMAGKTVLITGGNSGIGFEAAKILAEKGADITLACRNMQKTSDAIKLIQKDHPDAKLSSLTIDLSDQLSVKTAATEFKAANKKLDLLINNAGVMWAPKGSTTDGYEIHMGTNHLGHFTLTGLLLDLLTKTKNARVVTVSSVGHRMGKFDFSDLWLDQGYGRHQAYSNSKLANLMFTYELDRRFKKAGLDTQALAAHPGASSTNLAAPGFEMGGAKRMAKVAKCLTPFVTQSAVSGSLPTVRAATDPGAKGGQYYGPSMLEWMGRPVECGSTRYSKKTDVAEELWEVSEKLTGTYFSFA